MREMPEGQFFNARLFLPANVTVREAMTLAVLNQVHCIRVAYLPKQLEIVLRDSTEPYPSFRVIVILL